MVITIFGYLNDGRFGVSITERSVIEEIVCSDENFWLSKWAIWRFDNRSFGFRVTIVQIKKELIVSFRFGLELICFALPYRGPIVFLF